MNCIGSNNKNNNSNIVPVAEIVTIQDIELVPTVHKSQYMTPHHWLITNKAASPETEVVEVLIQQALPVTKGKYRKSSQSVTVMTKIQVLVIPPNCNSIILMSKQHRQQLQRQRRLL
jgi:hypothetical protein